MKPNVKPTDIDEYVNNKHSFIVFIERFSKLAVCFHFPELKHQLEKFVFDSKFKFHYAQPSIHTGNSDIEHLNNSLTENIRSLYLKEKSNIIAQMAKAIQFYNNIVQNTVGLRLSAMIVTRSIMDNRFLWLID